MGDGVSRETPGGAQALAWVDDALAALDRDGRLRTPPSARSLPPVSYCSNDYLALAGEPAAEGRSGAGASRLLGGHGDAHERLERAAAGWTGHEAALCFASGYAANVGLITALAGEGDTIVSDALNHASIVDGCRLSRARTLVVPHNDLDAVDEVLGSATGRKLVVTESYFSMDADGPDLPRLREVCDRHGAALVLDEAHALGVFGPSGAGLAAAAGVRPDATVGTLGKALGCSGAFVGCSQAVRSWLWNRARSFVFSTGMAPVVAATASRNLATVRGDEAARARLGLLVEGFRSALVRNGVEAMGHGPIVPVLVGDDGKAMAAAEALREEGFFVLAVRPPTVPRGTARLRITVRVDHDRRALDRLADAVKSALVQ